MIRINSTLLCLTAVDRWKFCVNMVSSSTAGLRRLVVTVCVCVCVGRRGLLVKGAVI